MKVIAVSVVLVAVSLVPGLVFGVETDGGNTQADQRRPFPARTGCVRVDVSRAKGPIKPMNAVCNGPHCTRPEATDQFMSNAHTYRMAKIPFARTHDAAFYNNYGGEHTVDVTAIFPDFSKDDRDPKNYDFALTDYYLENIRRAGTEPFFRLGQKIEHLPKKYGIMPPSDFDKFARICDRIVAHYNDGWANGHRWNIRYWEIWNEPDLDTEKAPEVKRNAAGLAANPRCWGGSEEQFFDLYEKTAKLLKKNYPECRIGGPAVAYRHDWARRFLVEMKRRDVPMDFFSWHMYTRSPRSLAENGRTYDRIITEAGYDRAKVESICDEWNYARDWQGGFIQNLRLIQGLHGAAFAAGCLCACQDAPVDMLMYYDARPCGFNGLWDAMLEPRKGYWAYYAWSKLAALGMQVTAEKVGLGEDIYAVAATDASRGKVGIFVVRYLEASDDEFVHGPKPVTVSLAGGSLAGATCHLTDTPMTYSQFDPETDPDGSLVFMLEPQSFVYIECDVSGKKVIR